MQTFGFQILTLKKIVFHELVYLERKKIFDLLGSIYRKNNNMNCHQFTVGEKETWILWRMAIQSCFFPLCLIAKKRHYFRELHMAI